MSYFFFRVAVALMHWWKWREGVLCDVSRRYLVYAYMVFDVGLRREGLRIDFYFYFFWTFFGGLFSFWRGGEERGEEEEEEEVVRR